MKHYCLICNAEINKYTAKYGTHKCRSCWQLGKNNNQYKTGVTIKENYCIDCGCDITTYSKRCIKCQGKKHSIKQKEKLKNPKNHPNYKGGISLNNKCVDCGKHIPKQTKRCKQCHIKYLQNYYQRKNNPNWKGGKSFEPYPLGWNKTFKEQIRYRDGYRCQLCGKPEIECNRKLDVHHIDYDKMNIKPENLISLCQSCHTKTNGNRNYWIYYFGGINEKETIKEF